MTSDPHPSIPLVHLAGEGPAIIFLHGFGADRLGWAPLIPWLSPDYALWAMELPAHGKAGRLPQSCTPGDLAEHLAARLGDARGHEIPDCFALAGHSLGGAVAAHIAKTHADWITRLVLIAPAGWGAGLDPAFLRGFATLQSTDETLTLLQRLVANPKLIQPGMAAHILAGLDTHTRRADLARLAEATLTMAQPPYPEQPTSIIWGREDRINPPDEERAWPPSITVHHLDGVGHLPHAEAGKAVASLIKAHLT